MHVCCWTQMAWNGVIWGLTLFLAVVVGWAITVLVLHLARVPQKTAEISSRDGHAHLLNDHPQERPILRGGRWIGILERIGVAGAILAGHPELIAVIVAVKGLGRYPELKDNPAASERFLIGTGASLLVAAGVAGLGRFLLAG